MFGAGLRSPESRSLELPRARLLTRTQRFWHLGAALVSAPFLFILFEELGALVHLVSPRWQDAKLIAFDHC